MTPTGATVGHPLLVALVVTVATTVASRGLPADWQALGVAAIFLGAAYVLVVRADDTSEIRHYGLSLGGLVEPEPLEMRRLILAGAQGLAWTGVLAVVIFPGFWLGFVWWWEPSGSFDWGLPPEVGSQVLGQLLVIALPEEFFYRGYLQTALDDALPPRRRWLEASVGWAIPLSSAAFALGHVATEPTPNRLAVFFPSLVFGWLRARTGGVGAPLAFHAACNLFAAFLIHGYGLDR